MAATRSRRQRAPHRHPVLVALALLSAGCGRFGYAPIAGEGDVDGGVRTDANEPADGTPLETAGRSISISYEHVCATVDGVLYCWGANDRGQLGLGDTDDRLAPHTVGDQTDWVRVATGWLHTCGLRQDGSLYCWGTNARGQLGLGPSAGPYISPTLVELPGPARWVDAGLYHSCAILDDDSTYCWGRNDEGQLGLDDPQGSPDALTPVRAALASAPDTLVAGHAHTLTLVGNQLHGTGRNFSNELGLDDEAPGQVRRFTPSASAPSWVQMSAGQNATCGVRMDRTLWCWGRNNGGELGVGDDDPHHTPSQVSAEYDWQQVSVDTFHACGIAAPRRLFCWGRNDEGQLAKIDLMDRFTPSAVDVFDHWESVEVGRFVTCAWRTDGSLWCVGRNGRGELGTGDLQRRSVMTEITLP